MKTRILTALGALLIPPMFATPAIAGAGGSLQAIGGVRFTHTSTAANTDGSATYLDHPLLNQDQSALVLVTQSWNPKGSAGVYNDHPIGVYFEPYLGGYWAIYNEDGADMPEGASFNVLVLSPGPDATIHTSSAGNIDGNSTELAFPASVDEPAARIFVTHNYNPSGFSGDVHPLATGVYLEGSY